MKKQQILTIVVLTIILLSFTSCQSKEERVINKLNSLSERLEKNGHDFNEEDWEEAFKNYEDIHKEMESCEFTRKELEEVGRADGKLTAIIVKEGAKALGRDMSIWLKNFSSYAKGFQESAKENFKEEDLNELGDQIISTLKDVKNELKE